MQDEALGLKRGGPLGIVIEQPELMANRSEPRRQQRTKRPWANNTDFHNTVSKRWTTKQQYSHVSGRGVLFSEKKRLSKRRLFAGLGALILADFGVLDHDVILVA